MVGSQNISHLDDYGLNSKLNVCVMYANEYAVSETFIRNQIQHLPENVFPLYGGYFPFLQPGRKHILSRNVFLRAVRNIRRNFSGVTPQQLMKEGLIHFLRKKRIDVVLANYAPTAVAVMECCQTAKVPLVVHFHGYDAYEYATIAEYEKEYKKMFKAVKKVVVVSRQMQNQVQSLGCDAGKIVVNACGVDTEYFSGGPSLSPPPVFIAVARLSAVKGPQYTIRAFEIVFRQIPDAKLLMVGDGELLDECKHLVSNLNLNASVEFTGALTVPEVLKRLRSSRVFLQHGIRNDQVIAEGLGLSVLEASSVGLPVVATRHGGLQETVVDGETGFLVEEGDIDAMADRMMTLAKDDALCLQMGTRGRSRVQSLFELRDRIRTLDNILREVAASSNN